MIALLLWAALALAEPVDAAADAAAVASAQQVLGNEAVIPGLPPGPPPPDAEVTPRAHELAKGLRCPVCQGLSVADSTSSAAVMFYERITELVRAGYTDDQISDFFVDRYGTWILLQPPAKGMNLVLLYLFPGLAIGGGIAWAAGTVTRWRKEPDEVPLPSDIGLVEKDKYEQMLLAELEEVRE